MEWRRRDWDCACFRAGLLAGDDRSHSLALMSFFCDFLLNLLEMSLFDSCEGRMGNGCF